VEAITAAAFSLLVPGGNYPQGVWILQGQLYYKNYHIYLSVYSYSSLFENPAFLIWDLSTFVIVIAQYQQSISRADVRLFHLFKINIG